MSLYELVDRVDEGIRSICSLDAELAFTMNIFEDGADKVLAHLLHVSRVVHLFFDQVVLGMLKREVLFLLLTFEILLLK